MTACTALIPSLRELRVAGYNIRFEIDEKIGVELDDASGDYQLKDVQNAGESSVR